MSKFTTEELKAFRAEYAKGATDTQFDLFIAEAEARNLRPGPHLVFQLRNAKEWDEDTRSYRYIKKPYWITTIGALRLIAQRTGVYAGQSPAEFIYLDEEGLPTIISHIPLPDKENRLLPREPWAVRVAIKRKDFDEPIIGMTRFEAVAAFREKEVNGKKVLSLNEIWSKRSPEMTQKCAEADGFRRAFSEEAGHLYLAEELKNEVEEILPERVTPASVVPLQPPVPAVNQTPAVPTDTPRPNETPAVVPTKEEVQETLKQSLPLIKQVAKLAEEGKQISPELTKALAAVPGLKPASELPTPVKKRGGRPKAKSPDNGRNIAAEGGITDEDFADAGEPLPEFDEAASLRESQEFVESVTNMTETEAEAQGLPDPPEHSKLPEKAERDSFIARTRALPEAGADIKSIGDYMLLLANKVGQPSKNLTVEDWKKALEKLEESKKSGTLKELLTEAKNVSMPAF